MPSGWWKIWKVWTTSAGLRSADCIFIRVRQPLSLLGKPVIRGPWDFSADALPVLAPKRLRPSSLVKWIILFLYFYSSDLYYKPISSFATAVNPLFKSTKLKQSFLPFNLGSGYNLGQQWRRCTYARAHFPQPGAPEPHPRSTKDIRPQ